MYLLLTNRARIFLGIKESQLTPANECRNRFLSWSVNIKTHENSDRDILYLVNEYSNVLIAICDIKKEDKDNIEAFISENIKKFFNKYLVSNEVSDEYIAENTTIKYCKSRNSITVARISVITRYFEKLLDDTNNLEMNNHELQQICRKSDIHEYYNNKADSNYCPIMLFLNKILEEYGNRSFKYGIEISIKMTVDNKDIIRKFKVPIGITFEQLHLVIQVVFDWYNINEYNFEITNTSTKSKDILINKILEDDNNISNCYLSSNKYIVDYMNKDYKCSYFYNFGGRWVHEITFGEIDNNYYNNGVVELESKGKRPTEYILKDRLITKKSSNIFYNKKYEKYIDISNSSDVYILKANNSKQIKRRLEHIFISNQIWVG